MDYEGQRLDGRYLIEELVGEGGMADVYRARDLKEERTVAVKILKDEFRDNEELVRRFLNEGRAISVLAHPNIVKVYDISVSDKIYYIVMEYIDGITLKEYIEQRGEPLTYKETVHFTSQTLLALQHAHAKGIVHRDIKPQNIMIMEDGSIRVMDFGIARLARSEVHTDADQAIGSVHYISPEQAQGAETDQRADIYSLGIMMYEMLCGQLPFEDENAVAIAVKQISDEAKPILEVNPSVPRGIADIANKAMSKNPADRYRDALDMLRDIEEFKKNPSIRFEYDYLPEEHSPARVMSKAMSSKKAPKPKRVKKIKRKKIGFLIPIVLGATLALVGVCALYAYNLLQSSEYPIFTSTEEIALPDFVGNNINEVIATLKKSPYSDLRYDIDEEVNPNVPAGQIILQTPQSSNDDPITVKANQSLHFVVSSGIAEVTIPDTVGMTKKQAIDVLLAEGITPYSRDVNAPGVSPGTVIGMDPAPYTRIYLTKGTTVTIEVASNFEEYKRTVPDLAHVASAEEAARILEKIGLYLGTVQEEISAEYAPGSVIRQDPPVGTTVEVAAEVNIVIALPPPVE